MTRRISATITVEGNDQQLAAYRKRVNELLAEDFDQPYRELHTAGRLDYRIEAAGVPYPPFVSASSEFPDLVIEVDWQDAASGTGGRTIIQAGRLADQSRADASAGTAQCEVRAERDGTLAIAIACRPYGEQGWLGYALTATQHAFFRLGRDGAHTLLLASDGVEPEWAERWTIDAGHAEYAELAPRQPIDAAALALLDRIANDFADEWIWFAEAPQEETAVERQRYAAYGYAVHPANLRSERLRGAMQESEGGYAFTALDEAGREAVALITRYWLQGERQ